MEGLRNRPDLNLECFSEVTPKEEKGAQLASEPKGAGNAIIRQANSNHRHFLLINFLWPWVPKHNPWNYL